MSGFKWRATGPSGSTISLPAADALWALIEGIQLWFHWRGLASTNGSYIAGFVALSVGSAVLFACGILAQMRSTYSTNPKTARRLRVLGGMFLSLFYVACSMLSDFGTPAFLGADSITGTILVALLFAFLLSRPTKPATAKTTANPGLTNANPQFRS